MFLKKTHKTLLIVFIVQTFYIAILKLNHYYASRDRSRICILDRSEVQTNKNVGELKFGSYFLYIIVFTAPDNYLRRQAIRETWGDIVNKYDYLKYSFVIGDIGVTESKLSEIQKENETFGDVVLLEGVEEVYNKLSRIIAERTPQGIAVKDDIIDELH